MNNFTITTPRKLEPNRCVIPLCYGKNNAPKIFRLLIIQQFVCFKQNRTTEANFKKWALRIFEEAFTRGTFPTYPFVEIKSIGPYDGVTFMFKEDSTPLIEFDSKLFHITEVESDLNFTEYTCAGPHRFHPSRVSSDMPLKQEPLKRGWGKLLNKPCTKLCPH